MHYKDQMDDDAFMDVYFAWAAAHAPIALQQGIVDVNEALGNGISIDNTLDYASTRAHTYLLRGIDHIRHGLDQRRISTNPFAIDHNWDKPTMGKQRWERDLLRTDPLEFPNMAPPGKLSHFHGRWRTTDVSGQARWVSYTPATFYDMFDLPPNLPQDDLHWYG